jgi:coatomer subunit beta'
MDANGKVIWSKQHEILTANIKTVSDLASIEDGERILVATKELGHCDVFPQSLQHSPNGRFVTVLGDGEYIIYTALAWRNKAFGKGQDFAWSPSSNEFVVKESAGKLVVFENFVESGVLRVAGSCERLFGGPLIGAACSGEQLCFYAWQGEQLVRRIDVEATEVIWSEETNKVAICTADGVYILQYHPEIYQAYLEQGMPIPEDGVEEALELVDEIGERATSGLWIGDAFVYCNANNRLAHRIGGETYQVAVHDMPVFLLGYLREESRLIVTDKDANLLSFRLPLVVLEYETAVLQGNHAKAKELLGSIPVDQRNRVARFLESQGMREEALSLSTDPEYRFDLAMALSRLDLAHEIVSSEAGSDHKWRLLGDKALSEWKIGLAEKCFWQGRDWASLLLLFSAAGNQAGLLKLAGEALKDGQHNIAFTCYFMTGRTQDCYNLLVESENLAEAAAFARAHLPSKIEEAVEKWRRVLVGSHVEERAAASLATPQANPDLFPEYSANLANEQRAGPIPAAAPFARSRAVSFDKSVLNDGSSLISDTISDGHTSLEVNTTGTRSILADDMDDLVSLRTGTAALSITDHHGALLEEDEFESEREPPPPPPPSLSSKVGSLPSQFDFFPEHPDEPPSSPSPALDNSAPDLMGDSSEPLEKSPIEGITLPTVINDDADDWL